MAADDWALVVGISVYPGLDNLEGTELDATSFYNWVVDPEGGAVPDAQARLVCSSKFNPPFESVTKAEPTTEAVVEFFDELQDMAEKKAANGESERLGRRLYLYFAGHGFAPSIDDAAILMANATPRRVGYHVPGRPWADWFYRAGYFDELVLFMDCCRENYAKVPLNLPPYMDLNAPEAVDRGKRFYVFGTKWARLSRERTMEDGKIHGVFTSALLAGLRQATDENGQVTALGLRSWLFNNMKFFFAKEDLDNVEVSKEPDIFAPSDPAKDFVIATVPPKKFKVRLALPAAASGKRVVVRDSRLNVVLSTTAAPPAWDFELPRGSYLAEMEGSLGTVFEISGIGAAAGGDGVTPVEFEITPGISLQVNTQDPAAEVFLLDGQFQVVDRGIGSLSTTQPPGIYKLKVRAGIAADERLLLLRGKSEVVNIGPLQFAAAAPLADTAQKHEYHIGAASAESQRVHVKAGSGSSIFVFARDWTPENELSWSGFNPAQALTLRRPDGTVIADFETQSAKDLSQDPWAACRVEVDPGFYRLTVRRQSGEAYEGCIVAIPGWHTQIFVLQRLERRDLTDKGEKVPDVARASVFLVPSPQFDAASPLNRLVETARQGLVNERRLISDELRAMLRQKFESPMLGIFGAHLLLLDPKPDVSLLRDVVANLREAVGAAHPDVEALALASGLPSDFIFHNPPMLLRSWSLAVEASADHPEIIPADCFSARIAARLTSQAPWLIWRAPEQDDAYTQAREADIETTLDSLLSPTGRTLDLLQKARAAAAAGDQITTLVRALGLPRSKVEELLKRRTGEPAK